MNSINPLPADTETTRARAARLYRVFVPYLAPYRGKIALAYVFLGASVAMNVARPWPLKLIIDSVVIRRQMVHDWIPLAGPWLAGLDRYWLLTILCGALIAIVLLESIFGYAQKLLLASVGQSATTDVLEHAYTHIQTLPRGAGMGDRMGDVIVRLTGDIKTMRDLLVDHVQKLGTYVLTFGSTLVAMLLLNAELALIAVALTPAIWCASSRFTRDIRAAAKLKRRKEGDVAAVVHETLGSLAAVQAFAQEDAERERFRREARESLEAGIESSRLSGAFSRSIRLLNAVGTALVLWFGTRKAIAGALSPGDLVVFASYTAELYAPIQNLSELAAKFVESMVSGERVLDLLSTRPAIRDAPHAVRAPRFMGQVEFDSVGFSYREGSEVLGDFSFRVEPGQTVALVGESGSGKSTVVNLLLRFIDPSNGRVLIDGRDIRQFKVRSVRAQISVVLQEPVLFRRTVAENIAYGEPHAPMPRVIEAAKAAHAHEFIRALPDGYRTVLEERGVDLSGGQRQRIALARAFLRNQPILVLDEPTTGLDPITESQLAETMRALAQGRTTIVVAHRLSTIEHADLILVLERGRILERGSHAELLARGGRYSRMYDTQIRDSRPDQLPQPGLR